MKNLVGFLILIIGLGSISAQSYNKRFSVPQNQVQNFSSSDTLKILAVMVDFQEDKYDATIGTGKFGSHYTHEYGDTIFDPLPHNAEYFADHLLFAKNYFSKVSKGKLNIAYKVLPEVITVSQTMREYVPGYKSNDFSPLGKFSKEVWEQADQKFSNVKFSDYNLFIIFHAGVSSASSIGGGIVNRNMPSLYLSASTLKSIFGNQFQGFSTKSGIIPNTVIMSETESREQEYIDGSVVLQQIGINGILVANIGSHIGLPDLFNTETGISAIGRFGLMDSQGMVANAGLFPPMTSPWEKMYLGWEQPQEVSISGGKVNIATRETAAASDTTLLKVPISSQEYYLVENRQQDAKKDNLILTIKKGNQIFKKTFLPDTSGFFNIYPADIKGGVVIDVDEYDTAVPGNGIVIWHIDESIINAKIGENKINSDLMYKGVDIEEADGIQDIGESFTSIFQDGLIIGEGTYEDFWHKGNKTKFYKNTFSPSSKPNTNSNLGSNSLITLDSFSELSNKMSFNVSYGNDQQKLVASFNLPSVSPETYNNILMLQGAKGYEYIVFSFWQMRKYSTEGKLLLETEMPGEGYTAIGTVLNGKQFIASSYFDNLNIYSNDISSNNINNSVLTIKTPSSIESNLVFFKRSGILYLTFGMNDGSLVEVDVEKLLHDGSLPKDSFKNVSSNSITKINRPFEDLDGYYSLISGDAANRLVVDSKGNQMPFIASNVLQNILVRDSNGDYLNIISFLDESEVPKVMVIRNGKFEDGFELHGENGWPNFAVADLFSNGKLFLITRNNIGLFAYNLHGTLLENFPITIEDRFFMGTPLVADINKDGIQEILVISNAGELYAFNPSNGKTISGYPLRNGIFLGPYSNPVLFSEELSTMGPLPTYRPVFGVVDYNGHLSAWQLSPVQGKVSWAAEYGNSSGNAYLELTNTYTPSSDFFPTTKAYNWPNPVYGSSTKIRYYVAENSTATVKIFDLSGELVTTLTGNATGGMDNEIEWQIGKVQSGVYYANLEVVSSSGKSANKIIKIAVIK